ncbi:class I SAM-dependent methyltransferase [Aquimarina sp. 2201CG1-2-11]|uniref:THUMP-like domain-containing protein n=1 Tax=Aquimarina discodermiae TaxID=3231043 RepID=UPI003461DB7F
MNTKVFHTDIQEFILEKSKPHIDLTNLILSGSPFHDISIQELAQQIQGKRKAKTKLPTWYSCNEIYYPPNLNLEQTSSETTALYKSNLVSGDYLLDLTGGFGIDDYYFAKRIKKVIHCELNETLSKIATHNFKALQQHNIATISGDSLKFLKQRPDLDWIYVDPSRRHESKGKVFFLEDCLPDVPNNLDLFFSKSKNILLKTSPLLDLRIGLKALKNVKEIHVVAVNNEVKELVWILEKDFVGDTTIVTINLQKKEDQEFSFIHAKEVLQEVHYATPQQYLYEPNSAILKSGGFLSIANAYQLKKLHINSHLYTSENLIDFPGRKFKIEATFPYQKKALSKVGIAKANITTRNFPESVAIIRKKFKIKEGGDQYLFFTTDCNAKKIIILCKKVV